jgi:hypothetical protein
VDVSDGDDTLGGLDVAGKGVRPAALCGEPDQTCQEDGQEDPNASAALNAPDCIRFHYQNLTTYGDAESMLKSKPQIEDGIV